MLCMGSQGACDQLVTTVANVETLKNPLTTELYLPKVLLHCVIVM